MKIICVYVLSSLCVNNNENMCSDNNNVIMKIINVNVNILL